MYMAVYDYDPYTMSPNPALAGEELAFHEGQIIKVIICLKWNLRIGPLIKNTIKNLKISIMITTI